MLARRCRQILFGRNRIMGSNLYITNPEIAQMDKSQYGARASSYEPDHFQIRAADKAMVIADFK
jgi:hypothetical protein